MVMPLTLLPAALTSVTYTMPASTAPRVTLASVDLTSASRVTGLTVRCALVNTAAAVVPHGTCSWHSATLTPDLARSASLVTRPGLLGGTAISIVFTANVADPVALPLSVTSFMFLVDADAKTSAGAPWLIWVARVELAPKLKVTLAPGCAASNCLPSVVNDSVSDAAANTVIEPVRRRPLLAPPVPPSVEPGPGLDEPHATSDAASGTAMNRTGTRIRMVTSSGFRQRHWST